MTDRVNDACFCKEMNTETPSIIVNKTDSNFSRAAVKLLLDNIIAPEEVESIFRTECKLKSEARNVTDCEFCNRKCTSCQLCCSNKGLQLYLLNKAMERINCMPSRCRSILCKSKDHNKSGDKCCGKCEKELTVISDSIAKQGAFDKLRTRLRNLKKYYPYIYKYKGNIIEEWGRNEMLCKMKPEILKFRSDKSDIFWI